LTLIFLYISTKNKSQKLTILLYRGENRLHFVHSTAWWWWCPLCTRPKRLVGFS